VSAPLVVFPDVVALVLDGMRAGLGALGVGAACVARLPAGYTPDAGPVVVVRRFGGVTRDYVLHDADVALEAWAADQQAAHDLMQLALGVTRALAGTRVGGESVYRVAETDGPAYAPDPESDQPRFTATVVVTVRGHQP
jgi:hypothetical protein